MTTPLNFSQPIVPGVGNHDPIPAETAKQIIAQLVPDVATKPELKAQLDSYVGAIVQQQGALGLTPQRAIEIAGAAQTFLGGRPDEIARAQLIERGLAADMSKLPQGFRETLQQQGATDDDVIAMARAANPGLPPKQALEKYYEVVKRTFAEDEKYRNGAWYTPPVYGQPPLAR